MMGPRMERMEARIWPGRVCQVPVAEGFFLAADLSIALADDLLPMMHGNDATSVSF